MSSHPKTLCVVGLGYIGLPTAAMFATRGLDVVGVDSDDNVVEALSKGTVHIQEPGLDVLVQAATKSRRLRVTSRPQPADVFIITVPTPLIPRESGGNALSRSVRAAERLDFQDGDGSKRADLSQVVAAAQSITPLLRPGNLIVLESTVPPGTTRQLLAPILETSGWKTTHERSSPDAVSQDPQRLLVAHCPERVLPGRTLEELVQNDRVIGGLTDEAATAAADLYALFVQGRIHLTDATTAEIAKLMENTYRDVNIALANEFALIAEKAGVDVWKAIEIANCHPRVNILRPGPGVGGHCIAVDPWFLVEVAPREAILISTAREVNDRMPKHIAALAKRAVSGIPEPIAACLGLAYKANIGDIRLSPAVEVVHELVASGFIVRAFDPYVGPGLIREQVSSLDEAVQDADIVVVLTDHKAFQQLPPGTLRRMRGSVVLDTRGRVAAQWSDDPQIRMLRLGNGRTLAATSRVPDEVIEEGL